MKNINMTGLELYLTIKKVLKRHSTVSLTFENTSTRLTDFVLYNDIVDEINKTENAEYLNDLTDNELLGYLTDDWGRITVNKQVWPRVKNCTIVIDYIRRHMMDMCTKEYIVKWTYAYYIDNHSYRYECRIATSANLTEALKSLLKQKIDLFS